MENTDVVKEPLTAEQVLETTDKVTTEEVTQDPKAGDKTDPNLLLKSLQEERDARRDGEAREKELEEQIKQLESSNTSSDEAFSDEGKALDQKFNDKTQALESQLAEIKKENAKKDLLIANPVIKEHLAEFEEYQADPDNKGMNMNTAAKAFMADKGLLETKRVGLEKPTGGGSQPSTVGKMTAADAKILRETNFKKYLEMVQNEQIEIVD